MKKGIIFFDLDDTLYTSTQFVDYARKESFKAMIHEGLNIDINTLFQKFEQIYNKEGSNSNQHYNKLLEYYQIPKPKIDRLVAIAVMTYHRAKEHLKDYKFEKVDKVLKELKKNYELGIISSGNGIKQWDKIYRLELDHYFNPELVFITESYFENEKQNNKNENFYKFIYDKVSAQYNNLWMIGDREDNDIIPAKNAGFKTIRIKGIGKYNGTNEDIKGPNRIENSVANLKIENIKDLLNYDLN